MACNYMTITCYYMHYQPLHASQDANGSGQFPSPSWPDRRRLEEILDLVSSGLLFSSAPEAWSPDGLGIRLGARHSWERFVLNDVPLDS
jgi:hypothetical protein